jgi:hypothetical protein
LPREESRRIPYIPKELHISGEKEITGRSETIKAEFSVSVRQYGLKKPAVRLLRYGVYVCPKRPSVAARYALSGGPFCEDNADRTRRLIGLHHQRNSGEVVAAARDALRIDIPSGLNCD